MDRITLQNENTVGYYADKISEALTAQENYTLIRMPHNADIPKFELYQNGFVFAERSLNTEIPISSYVPQIKNGNKFDYTVSKNWNPDNLYNISKPFFNDDCRFAVDIEKENKELKNELLYSYLISLKRQSRMATLCICSDEIIGFNIWDKDENTKNGRVLLGSMSDRYKGTGIALYLYLYTVQYMKECGITALSDKIFSSNISSLNLHIILSSHTGGGV